MLFRKISCWAYRFLMPQTSESLYPFTKIIDEGPVFGREPAFYDLV